MSAIIAFNVVPKLNLKLPPIEKQYSLWCIPITKLSLVLNIIGEPDEPLVVEALYFISQFSIIFILPYENDNSILLLVYCKINILWYFKLFILFNLILK